MENKIEYSKPVPPFVRFCAANIPMVFDDSLSYYEALCALWKWLQSDVIDVINNNAHVTQVWREELTEFEGNMTDKFNDLNDAFDTLKTWVETYFDNLDVQEEINNKLDDMAEQGVLADIISQYLNSIAVFGYDSVATMKSSSNLIAGSYARTSGYYAPNDGGEGFYRIREADNDDVEDNGAIIPMDDDTLVAELIVDDATVNVKQFGAKGDNTTDDTTAIQNAINFAQTAHFDCFIPSGTFLVSKITISNALNFYGEGNQSCIRAIDNDGEEAVVYVVDAGVANSHIHDFTIDGNKYNVATNTTGLKVFITNSTYAGDQYTNIHDLYIHLTKGSGLMTESNVGSAIREIRVDNVVINRADESGFHLSKTTDSVFTRCTASVCGRNGYYVPNGGSNKFVACKAFYCGIGDGTTPEDPARVPASAFTVTSDVTPVSGKKYYTRSGTDVENDYYEFALYTGSTFAEGTTYYEMTTLYSKRYAGFLISNTGTLLSECESQDNYGDGYDMSGSGCKFSNCSADNNGLITVDFEPVSYASQSKTQLYYGIYSHGWEFIAQGSSFLNHRQSSIGKCQKGAAYIVGGGHIIINGTISQQVVSSIVIQHVSNPKLISSNLNNEEWVYNIPLSSITLGTDITIKDASNNQLYYKNNMLFYRINLKKTGGILNSWHNVDVMTFPAGFYPRKFLPRTAIVTGNSGYNVEGICTCLINAGGKVTINYPNNSLDAMEEVIIEGSYTVSAE